MLSCGESLLVYCVDMTANCERRRSRNNRWKNARCRNGSLGNRWEMLVLCPIDPRRCRLRRFAPCKLLSILSPAGVGSPSYEVANHPQMKVGGEKNQSDGSIEGSFHCLALQYHTKSNSKSQPRRLFRAMMCAASLLKQHQGVVTVLITFVTQARLTSFCRPISDLFLAVPVASSAWYS